VDPRIALHTSTLSGALAVTKTGEILLSVPTPTCGAGQTVMLEQRFRGATIRHVSATAPVAARFHVFHGADGRSWRQRVPAYEGAGAATHAIMLRRPAPTTGD
jgi:hypothetical protein